MDDETEDAGAGRNLGGRPRIEFTDADVKTLTSLVRIHCTAEECASVLGVGKNTLDRRLKEMGWAGFQEFYDRHSAEGKASIRRLQYKEAERGNSTMLVWLGKQWLGQKDVSRQEMTGADGGPIQTVTRDADEFARRLAGLAARATGAGDEEADA